MNYFHELLFQRKSFEVISVSETWNSIKNPIVTKFNIAGYKSRSIISLTQNSDVGIYITHAFISKMHYDFYSKSIYFET